MAVVVTLVTERMIEPRLGKYEPEPPAGRRLGGIATMDIPDEAARRRPAGDESRGLRFALCGLLAVDRR